MLLASEPPIAELDVSIIVVVARAERRRKEAGAERDEASNIAPEGSKAGFTTD